MGVAGRADVAVVGAGVIGCAVARALARDHDVAVVERGQVAGAATARSAGLVTVTPSYSDVPSIAEHAGSFFRRYDGTGDFSFTPRESVELVPPDVEDASRRRIERLTGDGIDVEYLEPATVEDRYPRLDGSSFAGAVRYPDTGWVDPYTLATTLRADAESAGATFRTGTAVADVVVEDGRVAGVETSADRVSADAVVVAAGWRTADLLEGTVALPVRPYRTQCIVLDPGAPMADLPIGWVPGEHAYFRPEHNGDLLVGGWSFAEDDPEGASRSADEAFREHVAGLLPRVFEAVDDAGYVDGWAGVDGATPDTRPIVDGRTDARPAGDAPADVPDGLVVATGFHGRGVMTAPVAAAAVRELVAGDDAPFPVEPFALDRFESRSRDFAFHSISS